MAELLAEQRSNYATVARAIGYIRAHARSQPALADIAAEVGVSEYHLQRIFSQWAGVSPKRFLQYLTKEHAKQLLRQSKDVLAAAIEAGLSGPGRLHDLMITCEAMTPGEIKRQGEGVTLYYGIADTPFGVALIGWTQRGVCHMAFCDAACDQVIVQMLAEWPAAAHARDDVRARVLSSRIFPAEPRTEKLHLLLRGTNFQIKVWEALLKVEPARVVSYTTLARAAGVPNAQRTVGSAITANRIAFLIPCHRVIRQSGDVGRYRWGSDRKVAIQAWESFRYSI